MCRYHLESYVYAGPQPGFLKFEESYPRYFLLGVESGTFDYAVGELTGRASFGDLVFTPPGTMFQRKSHGEITFHVFEFTVDAEADGPDMPVPVGKVAIGDRGRLASSYSYLRNVWRDSRDISHESPIAGHMLSELLHLCELERQYTLQQKKTFDPLMQQAAGQMHRHLFDGTSMLDIASKLGIKPSELTRRFRLEYGATPIEYTTRLRLEEAKRLLRETNETMEAIAVRCGYDNGAYLSRVFHSKIGVTPSEFRKLYQI
ncbi:MAG: helix-turn-helix domain-containing protein [Paenibacillaceae bacterium]|nr:helix-turn-helix domain-containing protein [Paenibacillaceae bacterium]